MAYQSLAVSPPIVAPPGSRGPSSRQGLPKLPPSLPRPRMPGLQNESGTVSVNVRVTRWRARGGSPRAARSMSAQSARRAAAASACVRCTLPSGARQQPSRTSHVASSGPTLGARPRGFGMAVGTAVAAVAASAGGALRSCQPPCTVSQTLAWPPTPRGGAPTGLGCTLVAAGRAAEVASSTGTCCSTAATWYGGTTGTTSLGGGTTHDRQIVRVGWRHILVHGCWNIGRRVHH